MSKRVASGVIDFSKAKHIKSDDEVEEKKERRIWREFVFVGEKKPNKDILTKLSGNQKFSDDFPTMFKSMYYAETIKLSGRVPYTKITCKITFSCTSTEEDLLCAFFTDEGFEAEVSEINFKK